MATKAAYKRVSILTPLFTSIIHQCPPTPALEGICCHAEGATPFRLGSSRRERHSNLYVSLLSRHRPDPHPFLPGNFIIVGLPTLRLTHPSG